MEGLDFSTVFVWRAVERLLAVLIGGGSIYLGFRLFMELPKLTSDGEGRFELPGGVSIYVSRVGPGVFFALFGTALVGLSFIKVLSWETGETRVQMAQVEPSQSGNFSYASGELGDTQVSLERDTVIRDLRTLRKLETALADQASGGALALSASDVASVLITLPRVKRMMLHGVWDSDWGDYQAFARWVREGAQGPPPAGLADTAIEPFRQGS